MRYAQTAVAAAVALFVGGGTALACDAMKSSAARSIQTAQLQEKAIGTAQDRATDAAKDAVKDAASDQLNKTMPGMPSQPTMPDASGAAGAVPGTPSMPGTSVPGTPSVPGTQGVPKIPGQ